MFGKLLVELLIEILLLKKVLAVNQISVRERAQLVIQLKPQLKPIRWIISLTLIILLASRLYRSWFIHECFLLPRARALLVGGGEWMKLVCSSVSKSLENFKFWIKFHARMSRKLMTKRDLLIWIFMHLVHEWNSTFPARFYLKLENEQLLCCPKCNKI